MSAAPGSACICGVGATVWRTHRAWCPAGPPDPPATTVTGRNWPRPAVPAGVRGRLHRVVFSGLPDGDLMARCETCAELGAPWRSRFEGGRYEAAALARLAYMHSGLEQPAQAAARLELVREWAGRRLTPRRAASAHWSLGLAVLRRELVKILGPPPG